MQQRGAISLSMNLLVIIIISLVILSAGIVLLGKFIGGAEEIQNDLDQQTDQRLEQLLVDQGKSVALPFHQATIERGKSHVFGLGILNSYQEERTFVITVTADQYEGQSLGDQQATVTSWALYDSEPIRLAEQEHKKEPILIQPSEDALTGQYQFIIEVISEGEPHGNRQRIIVDVK